MTYTLNLPYLNKYTKYFNDLAKAGIDFDIQVSTNWNGELGTYIPTLFPQLKGIKNLETLSKAWCAGRTGLKTSTMTDFIDLRKIYSAPNALSVSESLYKGSHSAIKYYAEPIFKKLGHVNIYFLSNTPVEQKIEDNTYRICCTAGQYYDSTIVYCAPETDACYNYIDKGHIVVTVSTLDKPESCMFITNQLTLDMNYIIAAFSVCPEAVLNVVANKNFIPAKDVRLLLIKVEKNIPAKLQDKYQELKAAILADFEKNTCNVMIGQLTRKEAPYVEINNIRISLKKADYAAGGVSIEADNLAEVVFKSLNPNEEWDIFTLINIYTDWVEDQFKSIVLNEDCTGFKEEKQFKFKINNIPLTIECFKTNTRRAINDNFVNVDELSKVMKRASCFLPNADDPARNVTDFNNFVREVSRISLKSRDILANGLPVKTIYLDSDSGRYNKDATLKHPKLRFIRKDKNGAGFYLSIKHPDKKDNPGKTVERRVGKFAEFIKKVEAANRHSNFYHPTYDNNWVRTHEGGWEPRNGKPNDMGEELLELMDTYVEGIEKEDKDIFIGAINRELTEAEKRSEELLNDACKETGAFVGEKNGHKGYIVKGEIREYFVEQDSLRVYDNNTGTYYCVVNGNGDPGVGRDALVARLYALHADKMVTKTIKTLE